MNSPFLIIKIKPFTPEQYGVLLAFLYHPPIQIPFLSREVDTYFHKPTAFGVAYFDIGELPHQFKDEVEGRLRKQGAPASASRWTNVVLSM